MAGVKINTSSGSSQISGSVDVLSLGAMECLGECPLPSEGGIHPLDVTSDGVLVLGDSVWVAGNQSVCGLAVTSSASFLTKDVRRRLKQIGIDISFLAADHAGYAASSFAVEDVSWQGVASHAVVAHSLWCTTLLTWCPNPCPLREDPLEELVLPRPLISMAIHTWSFSGYMSQPGRPSSHTWCLRL